MQAVILAAGDSSRFYPYNSDHKACVRLLGKSLIGHTLLSIKKSGIKEVIVVVGNNEDIKNCIELDRISGLSITYVRQNSPKGMGDALLKIEKYIKGDFFLLHAHHVDFDEFEESMQKQRKGGESVLLAKKEFDVHKFGVLKVKGERVVDLVEKPSDKNNNTRHRVIGIYLLTKSFFQTLQDTPSEHYSFEHALSAFVKKNYVRMVETDKDIVSLKYPWDLLGINKYLLSSLKSKISKRAIIAKSASISGKVTIEDDVNVMDGATIKGPCYIGKNSYIGTRAIVRNNVSINEHVVVGANMEIKNSVVFDNTTTHSGFIGDSIIGKSCKIAAFFCTGNVRIDRQSVRVQTDKGKIDTNLYSLGVIMGNNVNVAVRGSTMPGIVIGNNVIVGPSTTVMENVVDSTTYYTKFKAVVKTNRESVSKKRNKLVLFDIDYTLFDVSYFDKNFYKQVSEIIGVNISLVKNAAYEVIDEEIKTDSIYDFNKFVLRFLSKLDKKIFHQKIISLLYDASFFKEGFYSDVEKTLLSLGKGTRIGIFYQGDDKFQRAKLKQSGFMHLLDKDLVYIVNPRKLDMIPHLREKHKEDEIFLVDDKPIVISEVKKHMPWVFVIWIKRGKFIEEAKHIPNFSPDATVTSLDQVVEIIGNN